MCAWPWVALEPSPGARSRPRLRCMERPSTRRTSVTRPRLRCTARPRRAKTASRSSLRSAASRMRSPSQPSPLKAAIQRRYIFMATAPTFPPKTNGSLPRVDGPLKVTGSAMYTSDHNLPGTLYAVPVCATIAKGTITSIEISRAEAMPGVKAVYHRGNIGKIFRAAPATGFSGIIDERRPPFEDDVVRYYGQYVAAVVAVTYEQAIAAANAVKVTYTIEKHDVREHLDAEDKPKIDSTRGTPDEAFAAAPVKIDETYVTPTETHNPIELHA